MSTVFSTSISSRETPSRPRISTASASISPYSPLVRSRSALAVSARYGLVKSCLRSAYIVLVQRDEHLSAGVEALVDVRRQPSRRQGPWVLEAEVEEVGSGIPELPFQLGLRDVQEAHAIPVALRADRAELRPGVRRDQVRGERGAVHDRRGLPEQLLERQACEPCPTGEARGRAGGQIGGGRGGRPRAGPAPPPVPENRGEPI